MHGGPICGLLARTIENRLHREDLVCSRLTVEILSGVPVGLLETSSELIKNGKRTAVVEASDSPITCSPYDLADGTVISSSERKWS